MMYMYCIIMYTGLYQELHVYVYVCVCSVFLILFNALLV